MANFNSQAKRKRELAKQDKHAAKDRKRALRKGRGTRRGRSCAREPHDDERCETRGEPLEGRGGVDEAREQGARCQRAADNGLSGDLHRRMNISGK